jgi:anti-sigma factor RsiW
MSEHDIDRDVDFVRHVAESYRPREFSSAERVAFRTRLDARIRRRAQLPIWIAGAATAAAVAVLVLVRGSLPVNAPAEPGTSAALDAEETLLALALPASDAEKLPADYQAIDDLLLEGEGV